MATATQAKCLRCSGGATDALASNNNTAGRLGAPATKRPARVPTEAMRPWSQTGYMHATHKHKNTTDEKQTKARDGLRRVASVFWAHPPPLNRQTLNLVLQVYLLVGVLFGGNGMVPSAGAPSLGVCGPTGDDRECIARQALASACCVMAALPSRPTRSIGTPALKIMPLPQNNAPHEQSLSQHSAHANGRHRWQSSCSAQATPLGRRSGVRVASLGLYTTACHRCATMA